jgi:histidine ammonia-lyase
MQTDFQYGIDHLTVDIALQIAAGTRRGILSPASVERIQKSTAAVASIVEKGRTVYGLYLRGRYPHIAV